MTIPERYQRNLDALSVEDCELLGKKRVLVVGCGGLGGYVLELLARTGVGQLDIIDGDVFAESNLNRQILSTERTLGMNKAEAALERLQLINPLVKTTAKAIYIDEENVDSFVDGCDCVVDALDSSQARRILSDSCRRQAVPLVHGAIAGWFGQVSVALPDDEEDVFTCLQKEKAQGIESSLGNLAATAATVGAIEAAEAIKLLLKRDTILHKKLLMIDLLESSFDVIELS